MKLPFCVACLAEGRSISRADQAMGREADRAMEPDNRVQAIAAKTVIKCCEPQVHA